MPNLSVDVAIIGAGTAGMGAYRAALAHTPRVVVIEDGPYGTTCARVGCMPSKLLIAAADAAHAIAHAPLFGVHGGSPRIDGRAVMERVRRERDRFVGFVTAAVQGWPAEHRLRGRARFVDPHMLEVHGHDGTNTRIAAGRIVIATGSRPTVPPGWRSALGERTITSDDVFDWPDLPRSVAVVGSGAIGLEMAQALHRLGVRVRLYGRSRRLGPLSDPALQSLALQIFSAELPLTLGVTHIEPRRTGEGIGDGIVVRSTTEQGEHEEAFDLLLCALGRTPNVDGLGLEAIGVPFDARGVPLHDRRSGKIEDSPGSKGLEDSSRSALFLAGDAAHDRPLLHEAADDGRIAGDNAGRWPDLRVHPRRAPLGVVFSDPQIAIAGASHAELIRDAVDFDSGTVGFDDQGRSRVMGQNRGALHVYGERGSGRFLGAEMLGPAAEHIGHLLAWSVQRGDTVQQMLDSPFYHPVVEEGLRSALRELRRTLKMGPPPVPRCLDCGPGG